MARWKEPEKGNKIIDKHGIEGVFVTGNGRPCVRPEGCTGMRVMVQWPDGRAWECTEAMEWIDGVYHINGQRD